MRNLHFTAAAAASLLAFALPISALAAESSGAYTSTAADSSAERTVAFRISGTTTDDYTKLVTEIQEKLGHPAADQTNPTAATGKTASAVPAPSAPDMQNDVQAISIDLGPFAFLNQKIVDVLAQYPQASVTITDEERTLTVPAGFEWIKSTDVTGYVGVNRLGQLIDQDRVGLEEQEAGIGVQIISPDAYAAAGLQPPADLTVILQGGKK